MMLTLRDTSKAVLFGKFVIKRWLMEYQENTNKNKEVSDLVSDEEKST